MFYMESLILHFLLLVLKIPLDFYSNSSYKQNKFPNTLIEKILEFASNSKNSIVIFNLSFTLLLVKINFDLKKQGRKIDKLVTYSLNHVKMILYC